MRSHKGNSCFFLVPLLRELLDMGAEPYFAGLTTPKGLGSLMVFLVVFVIPALLALPKLRTVATTIECGGG